MSLTGDTLAQPIPAPLNEQPEIPNLRWFSEAPLHLDLGCARGTFLREVALLHPDQHFLGIERLPGRVGRTQKKLLSPGLKNAVVLHGEILETLSTKIPENCADWIHILFPDPWPKRRHAQRRLVRKPAFPVLAKVLKPGGKLRFLTDSEPYFRETSAVLPTLEGWKILPTSPVDGWPMSEFQKKYTARRLPLYGWVLQKLAAE